MVKSWFKFDTFFDGLGGAGSELIRARGRAVELQLAPPCGRLREVCPLRARFLPRAKILSLTNALGTILFSS